MKRKELTGIFVCFALLFFAAYVFAAPVPDTGQTKCYDVAGSVIACPTPELGPLYGQPASAYASGLADSPWPMHGHDSHHTGQSQYQGIGYPILKWRYLTGGNGFSSPAIGSDGTVYVGSHNFYLYAIKPDGTLKWRYETGGIVNSPAIGSDGTVYVSFYKGGPYYDCYLDAIKPDGTLKWRYETGNTDYYLSSPAIGSDGTVYVGGGSCYLYAIKPDGTLKWRYQSQGLFYQALPAIGSDGTVYAINSDDSLYAIKPDGTLKWLYQMRSSWSCSSPAIGSDGTVYVGGYDFYAINPDGTLKWQFGTGPGHHNVTSPSIGLDGTVYFTHGNNVYALIDGNLKWGYKTISSVEWSSPAIGSDGMVYVGSEHAYLYLIKPDGTLKWMFETGGGYGGYSSPAIGSDGTVYVGSNDGYLYAIGMPTGKGAINGYVKDSIVPKFSWI